MSCLTEGLDKLLPTPGLPTSLRDMGHPAILGDLADLQSASQAQQQNGKTGGFSDGLKRGWGIGSKISSWIRRGSKLSTEFKEMSAWRAALQRDKKELDEAAGNLTITGGEGGPVASNGVPESYDLVNARIHYETAVIMQGYGQIAKDLVSDTDSFGMPDSRLGENAVEFERKIEGGVADSSISASVEDARKAYVQQVIAVQAKQSQ